MSRVVLALLLVAAVAHAERPRIVLGIPIVRGNLDTKIVTSTVEKSQAKLLACYKKALVDPAVEDGTATAAFTIQKNGTLTNVSTTVDGLPPKVQTCFTGVLSKIKFRKRPKEAVEVSMYLMELTRDAKPVAKKKPAKRRAARK